MRMVLSVAPGAALSALLRMGLPSEAGHPGPLPFHRAAFEALEETLSELGIGDVERSAPLPLVRLTMVLLAVALMHCRAAFPAVYRKSHLAAMPTACVLE